MIGNEAPVVPDRDVELLRDVQELPCHGLAPGDRCCVEMDLDATAPWRTRDQSSSLHLPQRLACLDHMLGTAHHVL
jgi:hypothetical protein